eukprot:CAMPEP_0177654626 /NCGR_PEP_ID=MMETSP0447-20121125/14447_1 /TAXON_ID=0 /ORGANISM="Stygamoeba regulata, Strain BSH-02190019" /LENGTH=170 /DNA_ID=CAMNT_0019158317 /DNA_START=9 /DNA_END=521 /DNA_ORIENTATION=-
MNKNIHAQLCAVLTDAYAGNPERATRAVDLVAKEAQGAGICSWSELQAFLSDNPAVPMGITLAVCNAPTNSLQALRSIKGENNEKGEDKVKKDKGKKDDKDKKDKKEDKKDKKDKEDKKDKDKKEDDKDKKKKEKGKQSEDSEDDVMPSGGPIAGPQMVAPPPPGVLENK